MRRNQPAGRGGGGIRTRSVTALQRGPRPAWGRGGGGARSHLSLDSPAADSSESMFWVKHLSSKPFFSSKLMKT